MSQTDSSCECDTSQPTALETIEKVLAAGMPLNAKWEPGCGIMVIRDAAGRIFKVEITQVDGPA